MNLTPIKGLLSSDYVEPMVFMKIGEESYFVEDEGEDNVTHHRNRLEYPPWLSKVIFSVHSIFGIKHFLRTLTSKTEPTFTPFLPVPLLFEIEPFMVRLLCRSSVGRVPLKNKFVSILYKSWRS